MKRKANGWKLTEESLSGAGGNRKNSNVRAKKGEKDENESRKIKIQREIKKETKTQTWIKKE
jgi:hypothetical protein